MSAPAMSNRFRKGSGEYLIFTDGDCIPRRDFVATHRELARPGRFVSGGFNFDIAYPISL